MQPLSFMKHQQWPQNEDAFLSPKSIRLPPPSMGWRLITIRILTLTGGSGALTLPDPPGSLTLQSCPSNRSAGKSVCPLESGRKSSSEVPR